MFFPILVDVERVVIIGGGAEWRRKVLKWSEIADEVLVVTEEPFEATQNTLFLEGTPSTADIPRLIEGATLVISEHRDPDFNRELYRVCRERNILINVVDNRELSNVYATSYIDKPNLVLTVSTRGRCAYYTKQLRMELEAQATHWNEIAGILAELRAGVPPRYRREALDTVYHSEEFKRLLEGRDYPAARRCALDIGRRYFAYEEPEAAARPAASDEVAESGA